MIALSPKTVRAALNLEPRACSATIRAKVIEFGTASIRPRQSPVPNQKHKKTREQKKGEKKYIRQKRIPDKKNTIQREKEQEKNNNTPLKSHSLSHTTGRQYDNALTLTTVGHHL
tara:strand:+ start:790 stop:1134 length:345 start_codon:yes stop_codon:yes gene_type:complete